MVGDMQDYLQCLKKPSSVIYRKSCAYIASVLTK